MDDSKQRKSGAVLAYVSIFINIIIQLLYTPLLIKMLGQNEYGLYSLIASIIGYLTVLDLGFGNAIIVYTAKYKAKNELNKEKKLHGMFKIIFIVIGIISALLGIILFFSIDKIFGNTMSISELNKMKIMTLILSFNLLLTFSFNIYNSIISAYEKFIFQKVMAIVGSLLKPLMMIPLLYLGYKSITMCIVITIVNIIVIISNYLYCKNKLKINIKFNGFDKPLFMVIMNYSIWLFVGSLVDKVNWSIDNFVLGATSGTTAVSIYTIASNLNNFFISLSTALSSLFLPKISKLIAKETNSDVLTQEFIKVGRLQHYIVFLMCCGLILFGKEFIIIWVGPKFEKSYYVTLLLIIPLCISLIQNLGISIRQAMNKHKFAAIINIIVAIINVIISIPLAKRYGATGAAFGTGVGIILSIIIIDVYYYKIIKLDVIKFWKSILKITIPLLIPFMAVVLIRKIIVLSGLIYIIVYGLIFMCLYATIAFTFCMNDYEKSIFKKILMKVGITNEVNNK